MDVVVFLFLGDGVIDVDGVELVFVETWVVAMNSD